jgi:hypothetical protein
MKKHVVFAALFSYSIIGFQSFAQFNTLKKGLEEKTSLNKSSIGLSEEEVAKGLKEALNMGIDKGVSKLSVNDGYFKDAAVKILMPDEAQIIESKLRAVGQGKLVDDVIESLNRAAEDAANSSKELFVNAIKNLTLKDAMNILNGSDDAATNYLKQETRSGLVIKFTPIIEASLDKVGATQKWALMMNAYNKIPLVKKVNPDLVDYSTSKAIDGLFVKVADEELEIRKNPSARTSELLKKVFN